MTLLPGRSVQPANCRWCCQQPTRLRSLVKACWLESVAVACEVLSQISPEFVGLWQSLVLGCTGWREAGAAWSWVASYFHQRCEDLFLEVVTSRLIRTISSSDQRPSHLMQPPAAHHHWLPSLEPKHEKWNGTFSQGICWWFCSWIYVCDVI